MDHSPASFDLELSHRDKIFLTGSCFAENIASYLEDHRFPIQKNPYGILFNPRSIQLSLEHILDKKEPDETFVLEREGSFMHFLGHSSLRAAAKAELKTKIAAEQNRAFEFLRSAKCLIITFGSAFVYHHKNLNSTVGNCHKQAQSLFEKRFLEPEVVVKEYKVLLSNLRKLNPELRIIFTVSPVKYLRDGLENHVLS